MKTWKHLNLENRKTISSGIAHNYKLIEISNLVCRDPRAISKEVKRNKISANGIDEPYSECVKLKRWPYVCTSKCNLKYQKCPYNKLKYDAKKADEMAKEKLINSRKGIDVSEEEFSKLDKVIKNGVDDNKSIYQITIENKDSINKSVTTLYRYINKGYLTTRRIDLPYAVKYKKRNYNKKYEYSDNKIDRSNHTYLDYLAFMHKHPGINVWQLDFLGAIKTDSKNILSFILPNVHFTILDIINNPNSELVVKFFDDLEKIIGTQAFIDLIPVILTDRDPCFSDIDGICFSKITGEERCKLFFCDSYTSNQKPNVENINKQIRKFFPKGKSIQQHTKETVRKNNIILLNTPIRSLDGYTPQEAFKTVYGEDLYYKITNIVNDERK